MYGSAQRAASASAVPEAGAICLCFVDGSVTRPSRHQQRPDLAPFAQEDATSPPTASAEGTHRRRSSPSLAPADGTICYSLCSRATLPRLPTGRGENGRGLTVGCVEPPPPPTIAPHVIAGIAATTVLHHDEPASQLVGMADSAGRHLASDGKLHLFHEYCASKYPPAKPGALC
jgi:hypothetical protein